MQSIKKFARYDSDPKVVSSGHSSLDGADRLARSLGWFSIALGLAELFAARSISRAIGAPEQEKVLRAFGGREIASGILTLSTEKRAGLASRIAGDALDIAALATALRPDNPKRGNAAFALAMVLGVTVLDVAGTQALAKRQSRERDRSEPMDYSDRTGFPLSGQTAPQSIAGNSAP